MSPFLSAGKLGSLASDPSDSSGGMQNDEVKAMTLSSIAQNDEVKKISAWAAILFAPTLVGTIYGMNFTHMPDLNWKYGYPMALALMLLSSLAVWVIGKRSGWL